MKPFDLRRAEVSAGTLAYADEGDGPPVLLLHGFPTSSHLWRDLLPMLSIRFRAIAPDLLGYGGSSKPDDVPLGIADQARYAGELVDELGLKRFAVVGHDIGGAIAQILALERDVPTVALLDSVTPWTRPSSPLAQLQRAEPARADERFAEGVVRAAFELGMRNRDRLANRDLEAFIGPWRADPPALIRAARALTSTGLEGREQELAELQPPTLVMWGEEDRFLPAETGERLWELLPDASYGALPGCGHYLTEDAADTVLPLVAQFLRSRYLGEQGHDHAEGGPVTLDLGISFERPAHPGTALVDE